MPVLWNQCSFSCCESLTKSPRPWLDQTCSARRLAALPSFRLDAIQVSVNAVPSNRGHSPKTHCLLSRHRQLCDFSVSQRHSQIQTLHKRTFSIEPLSSILRLVSDVVRAQRCCRKGARRRAADVPTTPSSLYSLVSSSFHRQLTQRHSFLTTCCKMERFFGKVVGRETKRQACLTQELSGCGAPLEYAVTASDATVRTSRPDPQS